MKTQYLLIIISKIKIALFWRHIPQDKLIFKINRSLHLLEYLIKTDKKWINNKWFKVLIVRMKIILREMSKVHQLLGNLIKTIIKKIVMKLRWKKNRKNHLMIIMKFKYKRRKKMTIIIKSPKKHIEWRFCIFQK